jgi:hypothetical protein
VLAVLTLNVEWNSYAFGDEISYEQKYASVRILHDKQRAFTALRKRFAETLDNAIKRAPPKSQSAKLKQFRSALR